MFHIVRSMATAMEDNSQLGTSLFILTNWFAWASKIHSALVLYNIIKNLIYQMQFTVLINS